MHGSGSPATPVAPVDPPHDGYYRMTVLEQCWGWVAGGPDTALPAVPAGRWSPGHALEAAVRPALERPPCLVSFSGGRDSSLVLAVALRVARREGLDAPVAFTRRFPGLDEAQEADWQEEIARFLHVGEWVRLDIHDELDLVGPVSGPSLRAHGMLWHPLVHQRVFDFSRAKGGSFVDGEGGDELFAPGRLMPLRALVTSRRPPSVRGLASAALAVAPAPVRGSAYRRHYRRHLQMPWLRPAARADFDRAVAADRAAEPADHRRALWQHRHLRGVSLMLRNMTRLASEADVVLSHPLLDDRVTASVAAAGGAVGFPGREHAMRRLFGDLLPEALLARRSKARFNRVAFNVHSRAFARSWDGRGLDEDLVDPEALRQTWLADEPHGLSFALLQSAWLAAQR